MKFFFNGLIAIGVIIGITLVIIFEFYVDLFGPNFEPSEVLVSTVVGASIALVGTLFTIYAANEAKNEERRQNDLALITGVFTKMQKITNNLFHFRDHLRESFSAADPSSHGKPALFVRALAGHPDPVVFTSDEKAVFLRWQLIELANDVAEWDDIHNSILRSFETYGSLRNSFTSNTPATMSGMVAKSEFTDEEFKKIEPQIAQMSDLVNQMRERVEADYPASTVVLKRLQTVLKEKCGIDLKMALPK